MTSVCDRRDKMLQRFPTVPDLVRWAGPSNWDKFATGDYSRIVTVPSSKLADLRDIYHTSSIASDIVYQNINAISKMSSARFAPEDSTIRTASNLFLARYGKTCTIYMMMTYFANYVSDYKRVMSTFDIGDLISGYRLFEGKWRIALGKVTDAQVWKDRTSKITGTQALIDYIRQAVDEYGVEEYIREGTRPYNADSDNADERNRPEFGGLIRLGLITPEKVQEIAQGCDEGLDDADEVF